MLVEWLFQSFCFALFLLPSDPNINAEWFGSFFIHVHFDVFQLFLSDSLTFNRIIVMVSLFGRWKFGIKEYFWLVLRYHFPIHRTLIFCCCRNGRNWLYSIAWFLFFFSVRLLCAVLFAVSLFFQRWCSSIIKQLIILPRVMPHHPNQYTQQKPDPNSMLCIQ